LLFGIIALQMDFISRDQLIAAMHAWVLDKHKPLGQVLSEQGGLSPEDHEAIEFLVRRHLLRHDNDAERSLAALSAIGQRLRDELSHIGDPDVEASLGCVAATRPDTESTLTYLGSPTTPGGRFRILRPHAQGGLGIVSVALDEELHREVALKEIQERYARDEQPRLRFLLEAEITGGLEHPGIVPVYGLGHHPDGRPFYAMRFVRGESLKEAVGRFHGGPDRDSAGSEGEPGRVSSGSVSEPRGAQATPLTFRRLLSRFLDVCNAIAYAHSRGVLHRDIKPGNILLGPYGETLVVDWGLAKVVGRDEPGASDPSAEPTLRPPSASGSGETIPGTALGTPAYMSPEQAQGRLDLLGPQSDVYSLGATLYVLLTGRPPFTGGDAAAVLPSVQRGEFARPRAVNPSIPKQLEAICIKAMARYQADRYATPRALAEDIEHWLADEPVSAYHEPWPDRARRWSRKHRTLVTSAAAVLVLALMGSVGFAAVVTGKNRELARQTKRAAAREAMAIDAVKRFRDVVVEEPVLKHNPALEALRKRLLKEPLAFFKLLREQLQSDNETGPEALARLARAAHEYAHLSQEIGDIQDSLRSHVESLAIWEKLVHDQPTKTGYQSDLATIENCRGTMLGTTGHPAEALESYGKALAIRQRLARENPSVTKFQSDLATTHNSVGVLQREMGLPDQALQSYGRALAIQARLAQENPSVNQFQRDLAGSHNNIAIVQSDTGHPDEALQSYGNVLAVRERLARENPNVTLLRRDLAVSYHNIGVLQRESGHLDLALQSHGKALAIQDPMARENPSVIEFQSDLALSHRNIGAVQRDTGHPNQALESYGKALSIWERLARENPSVTEFQDELAGTYNNVGLLQRDTGHPNQSLESHAKALAIRERQAREHPDSPVYASELGGTLNNMARIDIAAKRFGQARDKLRQAISWQKRALAANPAHPTYRQFLQNHLTNLAAAATGLGNAGEAGAAQRELDEFVASDPGKQALDSRLAAVIGGERPKDNGERLRLAYRAYEKKLNAESARLFAAALETDPRLANDRQGQHRYNAACAAALAAALGTAGAAQQETSGQAEKPLTDADRAKFRNQVRAWLEAELAIWTKLLASAKGEQRLTISKTLEHWQQDTDLASIRDEPVLAKMTENERGKWKELWVRVEALQSKARKP
jgi:serine/threonine-protein kinase